MEQLYVLCILACVGGAEGGEGEGGGARGWERTRGRRGNCVCTYTQQCSDSVM